jgi:hypothetical protein
MLYIYWNTNYSRRRFNLGPFINDNTNRMMPINECTRYNRLKRFLWELPIWIKMITLTNW